MELIIRAEQPGDELAIRHVLLTAFATAQEAELVDRLRSNARLSISLIAECNNSIIGQIAFNPVTLLSPSEISVIGLGLAPLAVVPQRQRQGVGSQLVRAGLAACMESAVRFIVVLGESKYYERFGFQTASSLGITNEYGVNDEFLIAVLSAAASLSPGLVRYAPEFGDISTSH